MRSSFPAITILAAAICVELLAGAALGVAPATKLKKTVSTSETIAPDTRSSVSMGVLPTLETYLSYVSKVKGASKETLNVAVPECASIETSRALATLVCKLASIDQAHNITLLSNDAADATDTIMIGTPAENAAIAQLASQLPIAYRGSAFFDASGQAISKQSGILALIRDPAEPSKTILVVTGDTPSGVLKAALALVNCELNPTVRGWTTIVNRAPVCPSSASKLPGPQQMPPRKTFSLRDLGQPSVTVRGPQPRRIRVEADTEPGMTLFGPPPQLRVAYGYGPGCDPKCSSLDVILNGVMIGSFGLSNPNGENRHCSELLLPTNHLGPMNQLEFVFHLQRKNSRQAIPANDSSLWGTLYCDTEMSISREYLPKVPDLSLFTYAGFPLVQNRSLESLSIVLPSQSQSIALKGLVDLSFLLGHWGALPADGLHVFTDSDLPKKVLKSSSLIILCPGIGSNKLQQELFKVSGDVQTDGLQHLKFGGSDARVGVVQETLSPWATDRSLLLLSSQEPVAFSSSVAGITNERIRERLTGSTCYISPPVILNSERVAIQRTIGNACLWHLASIELSSHVWEAPAIALSLVLLSVFTLKLFLQAKRGDSMRSLAVKKAGDFISLN
jgi:hypothetical protein